MNNVQLDHNKLTTLVSASYASLLLALLLFISPVFAATDMEGITADGGITVESIEALSAEELGDLVAPVALYPDDLLAILLPAATYPLQIVQAARFLEARENDPTFEPSEGWDDSIIALLNYPEIIALLNDDLDWTWQLGEAVLVQEADLIAAVSNFRERARIAGNLKSDNHQIVAVNDEGEIEIKPADPGVIYVPYYEPGKVTVYQRRPVYHYYSQAYPVYYYPYPADYAFSTRYFWGVTSVFSIAWHRHRLHLHHYGYDSHPYYNYSYYNPFYNRHPHLWLNHDYYRNYNHHRNRHQHGRHHPGNQWQPNHKIAGSRPRNPGLNHRDWRDERGLDQERHNRRREHVVAQRRSRNAGQHEALQRGSRLITRSTARDGAQKARQVHGGTRRDRPRVDMNADERRTAGVNRHANDIRITALTADSRGNDLEWMQRIVRSQSPERLSRQEIRSQSQERVARIERSTPARERRVEIRQGTSPQQARPKPARAQARVVRQERVPVVVRATAPVKTKHRLHESRSKTHAVKQQIAGNQRSARREYRR